MQLIPALVLAVAATACATTASPMTRTTPMSTQNAALVHRLYDEHLSTGRVDGLEDIIAPDFGGAGPSRGPAAFITVMSDLRNAFPDLVYTLDDVVAEGDRVAVRWTWRGTHRGAFRAFAPTGKAVTNTGFAIFQVANGKLVHAWVETDRLGFLQALGAIPYDPAFGPPRPAN